MNHVDFTSSEVVFLNKWLLKGFVIYLDFAAHAFLSSIKRNVSVPSLVASSLLQ